ncbi:hypothetical protein GCM10009087_41610 [Sphingomonas oligophenolica]|uniref:DUF4398 domain-containing protein n=1 Tax=Sphingomonas oligophenolica TaxID=301154 RepID=A0ABU9YBW2_9SPHN
MKRLLPLACAALLTGCAEQSASRYPSLLPRPIESRSDAEPVPAPVVAPAPDAPTDAKLAAMRTTLAEAASGFAPAADRAEQAAQAAKGQPAGSELWITAETALAELDGYRATTSATLTDVEEMAIERATAQLPEYPGIETLRTAAEAQLAAQSARIAAIQATLPEA